MNPLLHLSATELARRIRHRELTSREVVLTHIDHARQVNPGLNAIVADRFDIALAEADAADTRVASEPAHALPPLLGVPCTIKECFSLEGMPNSAGLKARSAIRSTTDATTVARLRAAGAIPIGVTNTSELCMWMETSNLVYGRTNNPYDASRIVGGSSGGEGSIVGSGASPFGLGSDIGGSIRMPAFFNGVFGHKPSGGAVPFTGQFPSAEGKAVRYLTTGPLCRRADDLMPLLRILAGPDGHDPGCESMTWPDPETIPVRSLRVLSIRANGLRPISRDLQLAHTRTLEALGQAGCSVREVELPLLKRSIEIWAAGLSTADGTPFKELLGQGKPIAVGSQLARWMAGRSDHTLPALALALVESIPFIASNNDPRPLQWATELRAQLDELLGDDGILIYPSYTRVAPRHRVPLRLPLDWAYTAIMNIMELPVTQVPTGLNAAGIPTGVQVVGPWGHDHLTIAVARHLESTLGGWVPPDSRPA
jgi:fatty acid amide hydrolase 2